MTAPGARFEGCWYPMGRAARIASNCETVLSIADSLWRDFPRLSDAAPVKLKIEVAGARATSPRSAPAPCYADRLISIVESPENFAIADMTAGEGVVRISRDVVEDAAWFTYHFLEPIVYVLLGARHFTMVHAASVALDGAAVLLCGPSGAGKTCLAYACARRGWSFLSGDATQLARDASAPMAIGRPFSMRLRYSAKTLFPELRDCLARMRPNGKCDLELDTRRLGLSVSVHADAAATIFLTRVPETAEPVLEPLRANDARPVLAAAIVLGDERSQAEQRDTLECLLQKPLFRLTYSDPFEAERALRRAMEQCG